MMSKIINRRRNDECQIHGAPSRAANRTLLLMVLAGIALIVWHVWVYRPTSQGTGTETVQRSFPLLLGREIWDLLFDRHGIAAELLDVFPYFIVGVLLAGYIRTYKIAVKLQTSLRRYGFLSVFLASLVGILTPLCACGTVTTAVSLLFAGIEKIVAAGVLSMNFGCGEPLLRKGLLDIASFASGRGLRVSMNSNGY